MKKWIPVIMVFLLISALAVPVFAEAEAEDDLVDIYIPIVDYSGNGALAYVDSLQKDDPDGVYKYFSEDYYIQTITEAERQEQLEKIFPISEKLMEVYKKVPGLNVVRKIETNEAGNEITLTIKKADYKKLNVSEQYTLMMCASSYGKLAEAYTLMPLEERNVRFSIVDENGNKLYEYQSVDPEEES